jgi:DNA-binding MarR family transcriptional regulator
MSLLTKISQAARNRTTYTAGLLQARAYRILKERTSVVLAPLGISTTEWALLGLLMDHKGMRPKQIADEIGIEASFVTVMTAHLKKNGWVQETSDTKDSRAKMLSLSSKGRAFVQKTEAHVRNEMRPLVAGASAGDLLGYIAVLEQIIKNSN